MELTSIIIIVAACFGALDGCKRHSGFTSENTLCGKIYGFSGICEPEDYPYKPGGQKVNLKPIEAPEAKMQENGVANVAKYLGMAVDIGDSAQEVAAAADKAFKAAKKLAASLSVWGSVFGALASQTPSAKDILDSVNTAFEEMARNVNNAFSDMQGYVDGEVLEAQKARWQDDYAAAYASFRGCLELEPLGDEKVNDCMVESERFSKTHKAVYMDYEPYMSVDTWDPTPKDIRHMEVQFLVFRDYVSLRVMMLLTLINTFQPLPDHDHQELTRI